MTEIEPNGTCPNVMRGEESDRAENTMIHATLPFPYPVPVGNSHNCYNARQGESHDREQRTTPRYKVCKKANATLCSETG